MSEYARTDNTSLRFNAWAARYGKETICSIIDAAPFCNISSLVEGRPYIQSTVHWREGEKLFVHGARKNKIIHALAQGHEAALAFTLFDGYVMTRAAFSHAVSYRSVMLFSKARMIDDLDERRRALRLFMERISPGRWNTVRLPTDEELKMTGILEFKIEEVSAKVMLQGEDLLKLMPGGEYEKPVDKPYSPWTGLLPYTMEQGEPLDAVELARRFGRTVSRIEE